MPESDYKMDDGNTWTASLAVNNTFDKNPPIIPSYRSTIGSQTGGLNSYDEWGRRYQLTVTMEF